MFTLTTPGALKAFFIALNSNAKTRLDFLIDPITTLRTHGIDVEKGSEFEAEIIKITNIIVQTLPTIANVPTGYAGVLLNVAAGNPPAPPSKKDDEMLLQ